MADNKQLLNFDPVTGLITYSAQEDGKEIIGYKQDVEPILEVCAEMRKTDDFWNEGVKNSFVHYASVPDAIILRMWIEDKCNFYDKNERPRILRLINTKYPECKVTTKNHEIRGS